MNIEEFYDADPRRRTSAEIELGRNWTDAHGVRYELSWIEDTGELYVMREPVPAMWATPFGGVHARGMHSLDEKEVGGMTVYVVAMLPTRADVDNALAGWEEIVDRQDSVAWLVDRLRASGVLAPGAPSVTG